MELTPEERRRIYEEEKTRLETAQSVPNKKQSPLAMVGVGCLTLIGLFVVALIVSIIFSPAEPPPPDKYDAMMISRDFVRDRLKAPGSAEFSGPDETRVSQLSGNEWKVVGWVDAQNLFGAKLRSHYFCTMTYRGARQWHLETLMIE